MALDLRKLAKVCAMFGSDFPDERATAATLANNMVRAAGVTWETVFQAIERAAEIQAAQAEAPDWHPVDREWREPQTIAEAIETCLEWPQALSERDQEFLINISSRRRLSEKQIKWLNDLLVKARAAAKLAGAFS